MCLLWTFDWSEWSANAWVKLAIKFIIDVVMSLHVKEKLAHPANSIFLLMHVTFKLEGPGWSGLVKF